MDGRPAQTCAVRQKRRNPCRTTTIAGAQARATGHLYEVSAEVTMWSQVERDLEQMLVAKIYRVLLVQDAVYRSFLMFAGLGPNFPSDGQIPSHLRENLAKAAKIRAHIIVSEIAGMNALE